MTKSLAKMQQEVFEWCTRKGWEPDLNRHFGLELALLHSEVSEALEEWRNFGDMETHMDGEKPVGVPPEFADILIRLLHYSAVHGIDLEEEFERKMAYNEKRPYRHGGRLPNGIT